MARDVIHADLEAFLTSWYRTALRSRTEPYAQGVVVDRVEYEPLPARLAVIRDDGGPETGVVTGERLVGVSVLAGTKEWPEDALDLARLMHALAPSIPSPDPSNPVAAVLERISPVLVSESQERARAYFTMRVSVVGQPFQ